MTSDNILPRCSTSLNARNIFFGDDVSYLARSTFSQLTRASPAAASYHTLAVLLFSLGNAIENVEVQRTGVYLLYASSVVG